MAVTAFVYGKALLSLANKEIDFNSDSMKAMLTTSSYTPDQDTHQYKSDVTNEVSGSGYIAGGATIANCTITYDAATNTVKFDGDDVEWNPSSLTGRRVVVYDSSPATDATRPLLCCIDFGQDVTSLNDRFKVVWAAAGIMTANAA